MTLPHDYLERVYAGVLGKIIGVYLGRPFEGWSYERITRELGEVDSYVHERFGAPLVVTDDDITGTFTFLRALPDHGNHRDLTPAQIGRTWLNYIIPERTVLWWGGLGNSTEHTAYLRLLHGIDAPRSGSRELNGRIVSEQIGAQIFIDGWALVAPGDPELAADLARRAASVSHDGESLNAAQVLAAIEAQAFVESDLNALIDVGVSVVPQDSLIYRMIAEIREWHQRDGDWRATRERIARSYGYDAFRGNCHIVPNHALIINALLYGDDDFQKTLTIVNTCGSDTDCNSGNVGCLLGIKNGLAALRAGPDWRGPVADRLYLPTADAGRAITDAVAETYHVVNIGRALQGSRPLRPKGGARFHFELPGSVQGFQPDDGPEVRGSISIENTLGYSRDGRRSLALRYQGVGPGRIARVGTPTFVPSAELARYFDQGGYPLVASPTLHPGQMVEARLSLDLASRPVDVNLYLRAYDGPADALSLHRGPRHRLEPGAAAELVWRIGDLGGAPIAEVGVELAGRQASSGTAYLDYLTWSGAPEVTFARPARGGSMWRRAWVSGVDHFFDDSPEAFRLAHDQGRGLLIQGLGGAVDYEVEATIHIQLASSVGLACRTQGLRRYYALLLTREGSARITKVVDRESVLAEAAYPWECGTAHRFTLQVAGNRLRGRVGASVLEAVDDDTPLAAGGIALVCEEGMVTTDAVALRPLDGC